MSFDIASSLVAGDHLAENQLCDELHGAWHMGQLIPEKNHQQIAASFCSTPVNPYSGWKPKHTPGTPREHHYTVSGLRFPCWGALRSQGKSDSHPSRKVSEGAESFCTLSRTNTRQAQACPVQQEAPGTPLPVRKGCAAIRGGFIALCSFLCE